MSTRCCLSVHLHCSIVTLSSLVCMARAPTYERRQTRNTHTQLNACMELVGYSSYQIVLHATAASHLLLVFRADIPPILYCCAEAFVRGCWPHRIRPLLLLLELLHIVVCYSQILKCLYLCWTTRPTRAEKAKRQPFAAILSDTNC